MPLGVFTELVANMKDNCTQSTRTISVEEQLAIFLFIGGVTKVIEMLKSGSSTAVIQLAGRSII